MTTIKQVVEDVQLDVRRSIYLIYALSEKSEDLDREVRSCLEEVNGVDTPKETRKRSANLRELQRLTELNALEEANYALESLDSIHRRLRDIIGEDSAKKLDKVKTDISFPLTPLKDSETTTSNPELLVDEVAKPTEVQADDTTLTPGKQVRETRSRSRTRDDTQTSSSDAQKSLETTVLEYSSAHVDVREENTAEVNVENLDKVLDESNDNKDEDNMDTSTDRKKRKRKSLFTPKKSRKRTDEPRYCTCNDVYYGDMIGCDNSDCKREWFHYECVGLKTAPRGKWYCSECRESMRPIPQRRSQRLK